MSDYVIIEGDTVQFVAAFGAATVTVKPGQMTGTGQSTVNGKKVCVAGDEANVMVAGCPYVMGSYTGGVGTLMIQSLAGNQKAQKTKSGGKPVILKGAQFTAKFQVTVPAMMTTPAGTQQPDSTTEYSGQGSFMTTNTVFKGL